MSERKHFIVPADAPVLELNSTDAFNKLTPKEKIYAHYMSKASWYGSLIVYVQTSPVSPLIFSLLQRIFLAESVENLKKSALTEVTEEEFNDFLIYWCAILSNAGNYKSFGNTKIVPNLSQSKFLAIIKSSLAFCQNKTQIQKLWDLSHNKIFSLDDNEKSIGLGNEGINTYFSGNCDYSDAELISDWLKLKNIEYENSRAFKIEDKQTGKTLYDVRLASVCTDSGCTTIGPEEYKDCLFQISRGDYSPILEYLNDNLIQAQDYVANENELEMLKYYVNHFQTGSIDDHKNGSRAWIKNKGPVVETYIGFIETYKDPVGSRGEFEGFVAMVNKDTSAKFNILVNSAEELLTKLPWDASFEKDSFLKPDFTSLEVLTFASSGIPIGINIPNYDDIRQTEGFKNVSLGNVLTSSFGVKSDLPFLSPQDKEILEKWRGKAFEVQVGLHELLGHGSGKLFEKNADGIFNFDNKTVTNPLTGNPVESWYEPGETYNSKFKTIGSSVEECRAECIGLYLSLERFVLNIFGYGEDVADDVIYANWLSLIYAGLGRATEMYNPKEDKWGQAHSQARYVISRMLLETANGLVEIVEKDDGKDMLITVDRSKLETDGKRALHDFLLKLQILKSTANYDEMKKMYDYYSEVPSGGRYPFLKWREVIMANKKPRSMFVQPNTVLNNDKTDVTLKTYASSATGLIQSFVERFPSTKIMDVMEELWEKDSIHYSNQ